jgi:hypothetical protein
LAGWAVTEDGMAARKLSSTTNIHDLLNCTGKGWQVVNKEDGTFCFPYSDEKNQKIWGWKIKYQH